jgi:hypothetical protein
MPRILKMSVKNKATRTANRQRHEHSITEMEITAIKPVLALELELVV